MNVQNPVATTDELLARLADWQKYAGVGDGGELPIVELSRNTGLAGRGKWEGYAWSFSDGCGKGIGETPAEALAACLADLAEAPSRAHQEEIRAAEGAVAWVLRVSREEAARRLRAVEGWEGSA